MERLIWALRDNSRASQFEYGANRRSLEADAVRIISTTSGVSRCSKETRSITSPNVGVSTATVMPRTSSSQVICASPSRSPWATVVTAYAMWWIRACIQDYILRSWSLVKIGTTANQKKLFFKLRSAKSKIAALESGDLHPDQVALIAKNLDVTNQDVVDMNRRLGGDKSINAPMHNDGETGEWQDHLVDQSPSPEAIVVEQDEKDRRLKALVAAIDVLDDRERRIFEARRLADEPLTLEDLAAKFNVSRERIRQIEARAFEKVRKAAKNLAVQAPAAVPAAFGV